MPFARMLFCLSHATLLLILPPLKLTRILEPEWQSSSNPLDSPLFHTDPLAFLPAGRTDPVSSVPIPPRYTTARPIPWH